MKAQILKKYRYLCNYKPIAMYYSLLLIIPIAVFLGLYYYIKSKKRTPEVIMATEELVEKDTNHEITEETPVPQRHLRTSHDLSKQCIRLLGGFIVKDKNGDDISNMFTPRLRLLLTMLILSTEENPDGISGDTIVERLWSNKNKYAARNNRNVSLTKLRGIFEKIGHIEIVNQGNYWKIVFGEDVLCDYSEVITYYQAIKENNLYDEFHLNILLNLLYSGSLLPRTESDWLDHYKGRFSYQTIEVLISLMNDSSITNDDFKLKIADTLLQHDYLNEEALQVQCLLLNKLGKVEEMNSRYHEFRTNYSNLLGIQYSKTLREIIKP